MPGADYSDAQDRADQFRRSDAKLRALADLLAYLTPAEAAVVASEIARDLACNFVGAHARLQ
jgi:hypothetical protein